MGKRPSTDRAELKLVKLDAKTSADVIALAELPLLIGRSPLAKIRLDDTFVSRCHCEIEEVAGAPIVRDLGSTHGTLVNGQAVIQSPLKLGDVLTIGGTSFKVARAQARRADSTKGHPVITAPRKTATRKRAG